MGGSLRNKEKKLTEERESWKGTTLLSTGFVRPFKAETLIVFAVIALDAAKHSATHPFSGRTG
jgi:hypothetical protein